MLGVSRYGEGRSCIGWWHSYRRFTKVYAMLTTTTFIERLSPRFLHCFERFVARQGRQKTHLCSAHVVVRLSERAPGAETHLHTSSTSQIVVSTCCSLAEMQGRPWRCAASMPTSGTARNSSMCRRSCNDAWDQHSAALAPGMTRMRR